MASHPAGTVSLALLAGAQAGARLRGEDEAARGERREGRGEPRYDHPTRLDTPLLFPGRDGGFLNLSNFRVLDWKPALRAADVQFRPPYALRHTYATWSIAAGVGMFELSRLMGTSLTQLDRTYGHLRADSLDQARTALDTFGDSDGTENREIIAFKRP